MDKLTLIELNSCNVFFIFFTLFLISPYASKSFQNIEVSKNTEPKLDSIFKKDNLINIEPEVVKVFISNDDRRRINGRLNKAEMHNFINFNNNNWNLQQALKNVINYIQELLSLSYNDLYSVFTFAPIQRLRRIISDIVANGQNLRPRMPHLYDLVIDSYTLLEQTYNRAYWFHFLTNPFLIGLFIGLPVVFFASRFLMNQITNRLDTAMQQIDNTGSRIITNFARWVWVRAIVGPASITYMALIRLFDAFRSFGGV